MNLQLQTQLGSVADRFTTVLAHDQVRGYPATPSYGLARISHVRSVAGLGGTLSYVDEDAQSVLYRTVERSADPPPDMVYHQQLLQFQRHATLEYLSGTTQHATIVTSRGAEGGRKIVEWRGIDCNVDECRSVLSGNAFVPENETTVATNIYDR